MVRNELFQAEGVNLKTGKSIKFSVPESISSFGTEALIKNVRVSHIEAPIETEFKQKYAVQISEFLSGQPITEVEEPENRPKIDLSKIKFQSGLSRPPISRAELLLGMLECMTIKSSEAEKGFMRMIQDSRQFDLQDKMAWLLRRQNAFNFAVNEAMKILSTHLDISDEFHFTHTKTGRPKFDRFTLAYSIPEELMPKDRSEKELLACLTILPDNDRNRILPLIKKLANESTYDSIRQAAEKKHKSIDLVSSLKSYNSKPY